MMFEDSWRVRARLYEGIEGCEGVPGWLVSIVGTGFRDARISGFERSESLHEGFSLVRALSDTFVVESGKADWKNRR